MPYFVYILVSEKDGTLYTGQTHNLHERLTKHNKGLIKTTRSKVPYQLGYFEVYDSRTQAMWREWEFKKRWNTDRKKKLIESFDKASVRKICEVFQNTELTDS